MSGTARSTAFWNPQRACCFLFDWFSASVLWQIQTERSQRDYSTLMRFHFLSLSPNFWRPPWIITATTFPFCYPPLSPGNWVNSTEWQANPAAVDGWVDPLRWDQCPGGGGEGGHGEHWPPLKGWPRGPGCWPPSCCPYWLSVWRGRPSPPPRRRRPLLNLKVSSRGWKGAKNKSTGGGAGATTICLFWL